MEKVFYWYNVAVQFIVEDENSGKVKKVKENYLVKAVSIGDAETQMIKFLDGSTGDYRILSTVESKINYVLKPQNTDLNE